MHPTLVAGVDVGGTKTHLRISFGAPAGLAPSAAAAGDPPRATQTTASTIIETASRTGMRQYYRTLSSSCDDPEGVPAPGGYKDSLMNVSQ